MTVFGDSTNGGNAVDDDDDVGVISNDEPNVDVETVLAGGVISSGEDEHEVEVEVDVDVEVECESVE